MKRMNWCLMSIWWKRFSSKKKMLNRQQLLQLDWKKPIQILLSPMNRWTRRLYLNPKILHRQKRWSFDLYVIIILLDYRHMKLNRCVQIRCIERFNLISFFLFSSFFFSYGKKKKIRINKIFLDYRQTHCDLYRSSFLLVQFQFAWVNRIRGFVSFLSLILLVLSFSLRIVLILCTRISTRASVMIVFLVLSTFSFRRKKTFVPLWIFLYSIPMKNMRVQ